jgi:hypothetical protein
LYLELITLELLLYLILERYDLLPKQNYSLQTDINYVTKEMAFNTALFYREETFKRNLNNLLQK